MSKREQRRKEEIRKGIESGNIERWSDAEAKEPSEAEKLVQMQGMGADYPENAQKNPETDEKIRKAQEYLFSGKAFKK